MLDDVVNGGNHVADEPVAGAVQHLENDQACPGRHAASRSRRVVAAAGNDPGDMRAVTVVIVGLRHVRDEVGEVHDTISAQVVVPVGNARIDDRDADAGAVHTELVTDLGRADGGGSPFQGSVDAAVQRDRQHVRTSGK